MSISAVLPKEKKYRIILALVLLSLVINLVRTFHPDSLLALIKEVAYDGDTKRVYLVTGMDRFLEGLNPPGNVVLKFNDFKKLERGIDDTGPLVIYFRSVYYLYPRKVFAVPPNTKVNDGKHILSNPFNPDMKWMQDNGVSTVININKVPGGIGYKIENIPFKEFAKPPEKNE